MDQPDLAAASRALKEATSALSRVLAQGLLTAGTQASRQITDELNDAARELSDTASSMARKYGQEMRSRQRAERTRAELIDAARKVFAEKGYEGASVGDIAAAAGYSKGAIYSNFDSKDDILLALAGQMLITDAATAQTPDVNLREYFGLDQASESRQSTLFVLELYLYAIRHPEARDELVAILAETQQRVNKMVHSARGVGEQVTQEDDDIAFALVALHTYGGIMAPLAKDADGFDETAATVDRLIQRLLGA